MKPIRLWEWDAMGPKYQLIAAGSEAYVAMVPGSLLDTPTQGAICTLIPSSCIVTQNAMGVFELEMTHPIDDEDRWSYIEPYRLISVYMPITPDNTMNYHFNAHDSDEYRFSNTISEQFFRIYKIEDSMDSQTRTVYANHLSYDLANAVAHYLAYSAAGNEEMLQNIVAKCSQYDGKNYSFDRLFYIAPPINFNWMQQRGPSSFYSVYDGTVTSNDTQVYNNILTGCGVAISGSLVFKNGQSVLYDDGIGIIQNGWMKYRPSDLTELPDAEKNVIFCLDGIDIDDIRIMAIRDNHNIRIRLYDTKGTSPYFGYNTGYSVIYGKNLRTLKWTIDTSNVVNMIIPYMTDSNPPDGEPEHKGLRANQGFPADKYSYMRRNSVGHAGVWAFQENVYCPESIPSPDNKRGLRLRMLETDDSVKDMTWGADNWSAAMISRCVEQFRLGCADPKISVTVSFQLLGETEEYRQLRDLEYVWLWSQIRVKYPPLNYDELLQVSEIKWDCLTQRYTQIQLGNIYNQAESEITY